MINKKKFPFYYYLRVCTKLFQKCQTTSNLNSKSVGTLKDAELLPRVCPRFFDQVGHETIYASSGNKHFFTKSCHRQT